MLTDRVPSRRRRNSCRPGVQSLKSPTTETGPGGRSAGSVKVSWYASRLRTLVDFSIFRPPPLSRDMQVHRVADRNSTAATTRRVMRSLSGEEVFRFRCAKQLPSVASNPMSSAADRYKWTALGTTTMGMLVATMSLVVALASSLRGGRYVHEEHAGVAVGGPVAGGGTAGEPDRDRDPDHRGRRGGGRLPDLHQPGDQQRAAGERERGAHPGEQGALAERARVDLAGLRLLGVAAHRRASTTTSAATASAAMP